jgi:hypothetical protein
MLPALRQNQNEVATILADRLKLAIEEVARKAARK